MELVEQAVIIRATMVRGANRVSSWDWYQAGRSVGSAPSLRDMTHYGVTTVEAYLYEGIGMTEALGKGLKAMSSWAISETRGTTSRAKAFKEDPTVNYASTVVPAKFLPELGVEELGVQEVEVLDTLRSLPGLDDMDREVLYLRSRGFEIKEIGDLVGLTKSGAFVRLKTAAEKARRVWADPVS